MLPLGNNFFPFREDPFQKGLGEQKDKQEVTKAVSLVQMVSRSSGVSTPLNL